MRVKDKLNMDIDGLIANGPINIVVFGDSVTHGALNGFNDYETVYWNLLKKRLNSVRDSIPVNMINAGIGGITAKRSIERLERDVLSHHPDMVIVCFGLNDVNGALEDYTYALSTIFEKCIRSGAEVIFMTPNMLNTYVAEDSPKQHMEYAAVTAQYQNSGKMDEFMSAAVEVAEKYGVSVCDCYSEWKKLYAAGEDTTMLLINRINHPDRHMHKLFSDMLFEIIMADAAIMNDTSANTMYRAKK